MKETQATYRIMDMDQAERPRERLARLGAGALGTSELLAIWGLLPGTKAVHDG